MSDIKQSVQDQFGKVAAHYKTSKVHAAGEDLGQIAQLIQQATTPDVIDVGCGAGHTTIAVAPYSQTVIAFDLTPKMLEQVESFVKEQGLLNVETRAGDVEQLPFEDQTFDIVVSRYSAHHWPNPTAALHECRRVLKPNGRFILSDIIAPETPGQDTFLQTVELLRDPSHVRDHSVSQWLAMFEQAHFRPALVSTWPLPLNFQDWVIRMATPDLNVKMLKSLFDTVSEELRASLDIGSDYNFALTGGLFEAHCVMTST